MTEIFGVPYEEYKQMSHEAKEELASHFPKPGEHQECNIEAKQSEYAEKRCFTDMVSSFDFYDGNDEISDEQFDGYSDNPDEYYYVEESPREVTPALTEVFGAYYEEYKQLSHEAKEELASHFPKPGEHQDVSITDHPDGASSKDESVDDSAISTYEDAIGLHDNYEQPESKEDLLEGKVDATATAAIPKADASVVVNQGSHYLEEMHCPIVTELNDFGFGSRDSLMNAMTDKQRSSLCYQAFSSEISVAKQKAIKKVDNQAYQQKLITSEMYRVNGEMRSFALRREYESGDFVYFSQRADGTHISQEARLLNVTGFRAVKYLSVYPEGLEALAVTWDGCPNEYISFRLKNEAFAVDPQHFLKRLESAGLCILGMTRIKKRLTELLMSFLLQNSEPKFIPYTYGWYKDKEAERWQDCNYGELTYEEVLSHE